MAYSKYMAWQVSTYNGISVSLIEQILHKFSLEMNGKANSTVNIAHFMNLKNNAYKKIMLSVSIPKWCKVVSKVVY